MYMSYRLPTVRFSQLLPTLSLLLNLSSTQTRIVHKRQTLTSRYLYPLEPQYLSHFQRLPWSALPRFLRYYLS